MYRFNPDGSSEFVDLLRQHMAKIASISPRSVWLQTTMLDRYLQAPSYWNYTTNRRAVMVNGWSAAFARSYPHMSVLDAASLSSTEFPELHSDGVHMHGFHDAFYNAVRDLILWDYCTGTTAQPS